MSIQTGEVLISFKVKSKSLILPFLMWVVSLLSTVGCGSGFDDMNHVSVGVTLFWWEIHGCIAGVCLGKLEAIYVKIQRGTVQEVLIYLPRPKCVHCSKKEWPLSFICNRTAES